MGTHEPLALTAGFILAGTLVKMTFNPPGPAPTSYDPAAEQKALTSVVMTSDSNRLVRLALGSIYAYASLTFAARMIAPGPDSVRLLTQVAAGDLPAIGKLALTWCGCMVDFFVAGVWLSSGAIGQ
jgi:hypothetical protein